jgi:hypothetical protein
MTRESQSILVLANSYKNKERCVAGLDLLTKKWIRPVSDRGQGELSGQEASVVLANGSSRPSAVGDIVEVQLGERTDEVWHPENRRLIGQMRLKLMLPKAKMFEVLHSVITRGGTVLGDFEPQIPLEEVRTRSNLQSLQLVRVPELVCEWRRPRFGTEWKLRGRFLIAGKELSLPITDSAFIEANRSTSKTFKVESPALTISLGSPFTPHNSDKEFCYKLIAAVIY